MSRPCGIFNDSYNKDVAIIRTRLQWGLFIGFLVLLFAVPLLVQGYMISFLINIGITLIVALGLNILLGYCGQISLGQSAFMAVGAFTSALLVVRLGISFWLALPLAGIVAGLVGMLFGSTSARLRGFYLALATLVAQFILIYVIIHFFGGSHGVRVPSPSIAGMALDSEPKYYYVVMIVAALLTYFAKNLMRSKTGRAFIAIRDNDIAAETMGINVIRYKLAAFFVGCFYAGIGGALWVFWLGSALAEQFTLIDSIWYLAIITVGGMGSITGTIFGTVFIRGIVELSQRLAPIIGQAIPALEITLIGSLPDILVGLSIVLFLIFEPRGLYHVWQKFKLSYRLHPFSHWE